MMVVILHLIRFGLIGVSLYMLYLAIQEFRSYPDWREWLMLSALVFNLVYLFAIPRLSLLIQAVVRRKDSIDRARPWARKGLQGCALALTGGDQHSPRPGE
jgi:hypothetical protein